MIIWNIFFTNLTLFLSGEGGERPFSITFEVIDISTWNFL